MKPFPALYIIVLAILFVGCRNSANQDFKTSSNDSISYTGPTTDSLKLVKSAALNFKVKNVEQGARQISSLVRQFSGMVYHQDLQSIEEGRKELPLSHDSLLVITTISPRAEMTVRVPSQNLESFLDGAADLGYFTGSSTLHIDDKSLAYLDNKLKQKNRVETLVSKVPAKGILAAEKTIAIKDEAVDKYIQNKTIDADVAYSVVRLSLFQNAVVRKETIANYVLSGYELPFKERLINSLHSGWDAFLNFFLALANLWAFLLLGLLVYALCRIVQKRRLTFISTKS